MKYSLLNSCKFLIQHCLPIKIRDDVCGDIEEEFTQLSRDSKAQYQTNFWLLKQTILTCGYFIMTVKKLWSLAIAVLSVGLFMLMAFAIIWLSNYSDISAFSEQFWYQFSTGNSHLVFFEANFWQYSLQSISKGMEFQLWLDSTAFIYSLIALFLLFKLNNRNNLSVKQYAILSISLMMLPYLIGSIIFAVKHVPLIEVGPIIATMWLTICYMILPICFQLIQKINNSQMKV